MDTETLAHVIQEGYGRVASVSTSERGLLREAVEYATDLLDRGEIRVAEPTPEGWRVNQWVKQAILLGFRLNSYRMIPGAPEGSVWWDKIPMKCHGWTAEDFARAGFRSVPGSIVRYPAHIGKNVVLMPGFVNVGAHIGEGTMVDTWATIGSCAQIGARVHVSGGAGIGGVLEPLQAAPVIIEDNVFIGARSEVAEGVRVGKGAVLSMGVFLGASTKIVHRETGQVFLGEVPPYSVLVPGTLPGTNWPHNESAPGTGCAVIVKTVDERTRSKVGINDILREVVEEKAS